MVNLNEARHRQTQQGKMFGEHKVERRGQFLISLKNLPLSPLTSEISLNISLMYWENVNN